MSKKIGQIVLMVVLLGALGVSTTVMIKNMNPPKKRPAAAATTPASTVTKATDSANKASAQANERNEQVAARTEGGVSNVSEEEKDFKDPYLNPNAFRVYEAKSPRNPFIQRINWYEDELSEQLPGYPEMAESEFFENMDLYLPDMKFLEDKDFSYFSIQRRRDNKYTISGESEDGQIQTQISLEQDIPAQASFSWTPDTGIPFESLKDPEFVRQAMASQPQPGVEQPGDPGSQGNQQYPGGMPGGVGQNGTPLRNPGDFQGMVTAEGTIISCRGVNVEGDRASALLTINGTVQLVTKGQVLAPRYRVQEITADGVVLEDIQDETIDFIRLENPVQ